MAVHSHAPIVGRADMLETPQQIISGAAADLGKEVANAVIALILCELARSFYSLTGALPIVIQYSLQVLLSCDVPAYFPSKVANCHH